MSKVSIAFDVGTSDENDIFCSGSLGDLEVNNNQGKNGNLQQLLERYLESGISRRLYFLSIYIYKTETFQAPTIFHISII